MIAPPRPIADPARRHRIALVVALILLASAGLRLWNLNKPAEHMFDEVYYAKDAKAIVDGRVGPKEPLRWAGGDEVSWPHPEMGKFAIAAGIILFGDRSFGWRLPAVIAGMAILACVYPLARRLGLSPSWSIIALLFAACDPLGITQSRIATLDVFIALWSTICILFALRYVQDGLRLRWLFICGAAAGMAIATKWSGGLALIAAVLIIVVAWVVNWRRAKAALPRAARRPDETGAPNLAGHRDGGGYVDDTGTEHHAGDEGYVADEGGEIASAGVEAATSLPRRWPYVLLALIVVPAAIYMLSFTQYFIAGHTLADWWELHRQAVNFNLHLNAKHTYASIAPSWIIDYRPVWYYFDGTAKTTYYGVIAIGNPLLWWSATFALVSAPIVALVRRSRGLPPAAALLPTAAIVAALYLPWFLTTRTSFLYYMAPVAPFLAILVAAGLCLVSGREEVPDKGWMAVAIPAVVTAFLWLQIAHAAAWLFWDLPRRAGDVYGWFGLAAGLLCCVAIVLALTLPKARPLRPWAALVSAGVISGIVVGFIPIVLALPIKPEYFMQITWFQTWI